MGRRFVMPALRSFSEGGIIMPALRSLGEGGICYGKPLRALRFPSDLAVNLDQFRL